MGFQTRFPGTLPGLGPRLFAPGCSVWAHKPESPRPQDPGPPHSNFFPTAHSPEALFTNHDQVRQAGSTNRQTYETVDGLFPPLPRTLHTPPLNPPFRALFSCQASRVPLGILLLVPRKRNSRFSVNIMSVLVGVADAVVSGGSER